MKHNFNEDREFDEDITFGEFIRKKRRILGLNQVDFSEMLNVDPGPVSMWEIGKTSPPIDKATEIVERLGGLVRIENCIIGTRECPMGYNPWQE